MEIETYEIEETTVEERGDVEGEALALIEELDLGGQKELVVPGESGDERIPYPEMSAHERAVYGECFPQRDELSKYRAGIIPVRVLQVAKHATGLFNKLEVWHTKVTDPDPVLVGFLGKNDYNARRFLLARWGDALVSFAELVKRAREMLTARLRREAETAEAKCHAFAQNVEAHVEDALAGRHVGQPWY